MAGAPPLLGTATVPACMEDNQGHRFNDRIDRVPGIDMHHGACSRARKLLIPYINIANV